MLIMRRDEPDRIRSIRRIEDPLSKRRAPLLFKSVTWRGAPVNHHSILGGSGTFKFKAGTVLNVTIIGPIIDPLETTGKIWMLLFEDDGYLIINDDIQLGVFHKVG